MCGLLTSGFANGSVPLEQSFFGGTAARRAALIGTPTRTLIGTPTRNGAVMAQARYFVVNRDGEWKIKYRKELFGPYRSEAEALLFAIDAAHGIGARSGGSEVLVECGKYCFRPKWTFGQSPFPPRYM
jgi:hypothetical protein